MVLLVSSAARGKTTQEEDRPEPGRALNTELRSMGFAQGDVEEV